MYIKDGKLSRCKQIVIEEQVVFNPTAEQIAEAGWTEYVPPVVEPYVPTYEERVVEKIRARYSVDDHAHPYHTNLLHDGNTLYRRSS